MEFNLGTLVTAVIAAFITGMGTSALGILVAYSGRLATFSTKLDNMQDTLSQHTSAPTVYCSLHEKVIDDVQRLKTQVAIDTGRIDKLEDGNRG